MVFCGMVRGPGLCGPYCGIKCKNWCVTQAVELNLLFHFAKKRQIGLVAVVYFMEYIILINSSLPISEANNKFLFSAITNYNKISDSNKKNCLIILYIRYPKWVSLGQNQGIGRAVPFLEAPVADLFPGLFQLPQVSTFLVLWPLAHFKAQGSPSLRLCSCLLLFCGPPVTTRTPPG